MKYIHEAIVNHLNMKTTGALLLTGDWGSGKTYFIKNKVFPFIEDNTEFTPLIVSLYGVSNKSEIGQKVLFSYFDKKGENSDISTGTIAKNLKNLTDAIPIIKKYLNVEKLITGTGDNLFKLLPHDKLLICFDDLERMSKDFKVNDFLGLVNGLVENNGCKILIIVNENEIDEGIKYKEKTIEKTIYFTPDLSSIIDSIIQSYGDSDFQDYLKKNKDFILETLNPNIKNPEFKQELKQSFSNIRTLKFAIEHFNYAFEILKRKGNLSEELASLQLRNIWVFTLAVSIESRKPNNITFDNRKELDRQTSTIDEFDIDIGNFKIENFTNKTEEKKLSFSEKFKELYFNRISQNYIFHSEVYDLITASKKINESFFLENLEKNFKIKEGDIHPAHQLLSRFMTRYWDQTNDEFKENLNSLLEYVNKGALLDLTSYLNSGVFLLSFSDLFDSNKDEVKEKIKEGIDSFLRNTPLNPFMISTFQMVQGDFKDDKLIELVKFANERISEIENEKNIQSAKRLSNLIMEDTSKFVKEFIPGDSSLKFPTKSFYHQLDSEKVKKSVSKWDGNTIMDIYQFLEIRYIKTNYNDALIEEMEFLDNLEKGVELLDLNEKSLTNYLISSKLVPMIEKCKLKLET
uniref:P-loop NTPase fold protein n=1 Tax=uncultured Polaribacter sp. TaxID=174711 RepID=UPI00262D3CB8|nr:P-loop NTPase fold protein [uncultured Polaribacter sp.]